MKYLLSLLILCGALSLASSTVASQQVCFEGGCAGEKNGGGK